MKLWRFALNLIPAAAARVDRIEAIRMSRELLDGFVSRIQPPKLLNLFAGLDLLVPEKVPWWGALRIWGDESSHDVQIWFVDYRHLP